MKALLIKQCPDRLRWYSSLVGKCVPYINDAGYNEYRSRESSGHVNFVQYEDAEIIQYRIKNSLDNCIHSSQFTEVKTMIIDSNIQSYLSKYLESGRRSERNTIVNVQKACGISYSDAIKLVEFGVEQKELLLVGDQEWLHKFNDEIKLVVEYGIDNGEVQIQCPHCFTVRGVSEDIGDALGSQYRDNLCKGHYEISSDAMEFSLERIYKKI